MKFVKDRCRPAWTYSSRGVLWHLQTGSPRFLVGEDRVLETKDVSYFCLDRQTGTPRWERFVPPGGWWSGIETVVGEIVVLHGFASPDMPFHRGLTAVHLASGSVVWSQPSHRLLRVESGVLVVVKDGPEGAIVERLAVDTETVPGGAGPASEPSAILPRIFVETEIEEAGLLAAIRAAIPESVSPSSVFIARSGEHCVLAYGEQLARDREDKPAVRLSVVVLGGPRRSRLFSDVMSETAGAMTPEPFFLQQQILYFVKERSTLVAVPLRSS
jgi:hypothetical protein